MNLNIYIIAYNEEVMIEKFINHYKQRFPKCNITVYDNYSTDKTVEIASSMGCQIIMHNTNGEIRDDLYLEIKNNCWKHSNSDWVLICDVDELVFIDEDDLIKEDAEGVSIIKFEGWNMITMSSDPDIIDLNLEWGSRAKQYDKYYMFNKSKIQEINYTPGCHYANPKGEVKFSDKSYLMCHFKALGLNYMINRHIEFGKRLSQQNLEKGWGFHYLDSADTIRNNWKFYQEHPENKKVL